MQGGSTIADHPCGQRCAVRCIDDQQGSDCPARAEGLDRHRFDGPQRDLGDVVELQRVRRIELSECVDVEQVVQLGNDHPVGRRAVAQ